MGQEFMEQLRDCGVDRNKRIVLIFFKRGNW
jgi:hypothetical protein